MSTELYSKDIAQALDTSCTRRDRVISIDPEGDNRWCGSLESPYATWDRALADIPERIDHRIRVKCSSGIYTNFLPHIRHRIGRDGLLSFECSDPPSIVSGPFTVSQVTEVGYSTVKSGLNIRADGVTWSPDQWYGKFIRFETGFCAGTAHAILYTSEDTIETTMPRWYSVSPGDVFYVVEPAAKIITDRAVVFSIRSDGIAGRYLSNWIMANLEFQTNLAYSEVYDNWQPYGINENVNGLFGVVRFDGLNPYTSVLEQDSGIINLAGVEQFNPPKQILEDDRLIIGPWTEACGSAQITAGDTPPTTPRCWYSISGGNSTERGVMINGVVCRNGVCVDSSRAEMSNLGAGWINIDHGSDAQCLYSRIRAGGLGKNAIRVDDGSSCSFQESWVDSSDDNAILLEDGSFIELEDVGGTKADIVDYGMLATRGVNATCTGIVDIEGQKGQVRLNQSEETVTWPAAAKENRNDGKGTNINR